jgi:hypothetical protein
MIASNKHRPPDERLEIHEVTLENAHNWVVLKGTEKARIGKYEHETVKADLYVALQNLCDSWINEYPLGDGALVSDLTIGFRGAVFHLEVDLGNMEAERLFDKIERYRQFSGSGEKVVFILQDGKYKVNQTGSRLMKYCTERRLGNFVTGTLLENFIKHPLGDVLISPKDGRISIIKLCPETFDESPLELDF